MFTTDADPINNALASSQPVYARQIGGITWMRVINDHRDFDLFEYWVGPDHPIQPASVDPDYPMHMRPKLHRVLAAARAHNASLQPEEEKTDSGIPETDVSAGGAPKQKEAPYDFAPWKPPHSHTEVI